MTDPVVSSYPGYATPAFQFCGPDGPAWQVTAQPWDRVLGGVQEYKGLGWTAFTPRGHTVGLFPDKQAAGEALVKHAGYEVLG